jgi:hypothetical protein
LTTEVSCWYDDLICAFISLNSATFFFTVWFLPAICCSTAEELITSSQMLHLISMRNGIELALSTAAPNRLGGFVSYF